jgi:hypothetical protein
MNHLLVVTAWSIGYVALYLTIDWVMDRRDRKRSSDPFAMTSRRHGGDS